MKGIDISEHNGKINFEKLKKEIDFVIIRATVGKKKKDKKFEYNYKECERLNIPYGVYVYSYALNIADAQEEAKFLLETIKDCKLSFPVVIDMEDADGYKKKYGMPKNSLLVEICETECLMFEKVGYYAMIYASKSWFDTKLKSKKLDRFDKWIAWWNKDAEINKLKYGIWQYSDKVKLIGKNFDGDIAYLDYPSIIKKEEIIISDPKDEKEFDFLPGEFAKIEVKYTGSNTIKNALVELDNNQFWIGLDEFCIDMPSGKYYIYGQIAYISETASGLAFHFWDALNQKREFQLRIDNQRLVKM